MDKLIIWQGQIFSSLITEGNVQYEFNPNSDILDPNLDQVRQQQMNNTRLLLMNNTRLLLIQMHGEPLRDPMCSCAHDSAARAPGRMRCKCRPHFHLENT